MYFKVIIEAGHMRTSGNFEIVRYIEAENAVALFDVIQQLPGLVTKELGYRVSMVKPISITEYKKGKADEKHETRRLRVHVRYDIRRNCVLEPIRGDLDGEGKIAGETADISAGGIGVVYIGPKLEEGCLIGVSVDELGIAGKMAEVIWSKQSESGISMGMRWL